MSFSAGALARVEGEGGIWQLCSGRGGGGCGVFVCVGGMRMAVRKLGVLLSLALCAGLREKGAPGGGQPRVCVCMCWVKVEGGDMMLVMRCD